MNINTENLHFVLQNNPEWLFVQLIENAKYTEEEIKILRSMISITKDNLTDYCKKLEFQIWYNNVNWFRKMWWKLRRYNNYELLKIFNSNEK